MKSSFHLYQCIFVGSRPLIKIPYLLILDTFVDPPLPLQIFWLCQEYVFQNRGVLCNYRVWEEETKRKIFGLMFRGGRL